MDSLHPSERLPPDRIKSNLLKRISLFAAALLFVSAGIAHFFLTPVLARIVPPFLPSHRLLVYISGVAEISGAIGLLVPALRCRAGWGLVLLLIAVFPANLYMAIDRVQVTSTPAPQWLLWARLPLQGLLIWWILWITRESAYRVHRERDIVVE